MLLILPLAVYLMIVVLVRDRFAPGWRSALISAAVLWGAILAAITEILSLAHAVTRTGIAAAWLCILVVLFVMYRWSDRSRPRAAWRFGLEKSSPLEAGQRFLLAGVIGIAALVGATALISAPNSGDAMEYHLGRVILWMSNRDVAPYPTWDYAQLVHGPWAEYAMLHLTLLAGNDRFVNLIEWFSLAGCMISVSLIASCLGAGRWGQLLAAVLCATIPQGILEASGPMNMYVTSFWLVAFVYLLLLWREKQDWFNSAVLGSAAGLAVLTKGLAYLVLPPFLILACLWKPKSGTMWLKRIAVVGSLALALNAPQYLRNYQVTGSPLGVPVPESNPRVRYAVDRISLKGMYSNLVRNASNHLGTPSEKINTVIQAVFERAIRAAGADPKDPETTWREFTISKPSGMEIHAGNPLHFALLIMAIAIVLLRWKSFPNPRLAVLYTTGVCGAFFLISVLLKWNKWSGRYHLPLFVLGAALTGVFLEQFWKKRARVSMAAVLMIFALPFVLFNQLRPLIFPLASWSPKSSILERSRSEQYFADDHDFLEPSFVNAANAVKATSCPNVGIDATLDLWAYPLMAFIGADSGQRTVQFTGVLNPTSRYKRSADPCVVVCLGCANVSRKWAEYASVGGRASVFGEVAVFGPVGSVKNEAAPAQLTDRRTAAEVLSDIDKDRSALGAIDIGATSRLVERAVIDWPSRQRELAVKSAVARGLVGDANRLNEYLEPLRLRVLANQSTPSDYYTLLTAEEAIRAWTAALQRELAKVQGTVAQMYTQR